MMVQRAGLVTRRVDRTVATGCLQDCYQLAVRDSMAVGIIILAVSRAADGNIVGMLKCGAPRACPSLCQHCQHSSDGRAVPL